MKALKLYAVFMAGLWFISACSTTPTPDRAAPTTLPVVKQATTNTDQPISVIAVGDIMLGTDFPRNHLPPDNGRQLLLHVEHILADADITFGNYEGSLLSGGEPAKTCRVQQHCYVFRTPPEFAVNLVRAGFDVMSLANNHARDFGDAGRLASMAVLDKYGILHSGLEGDVARWEVRGRKLALIAFAPFRGANNPLLIPQARTLVAEVSRTSDIVLVSMHMGAEGEEATRLPFAEEYYHGENRGDVVAFSRAVIEAGADLVIGHGPHVPRAIELYKGRLIAYSLGNFCTFYGINVNGLNGLAPILKVQLTGDGTFVQGKIISARQQRPNGPIPDPSHQAARLIAELSRLDLPDNPLEISQDGLISMKSGK